MTTGQNSGMPASKKPVRAIAQSAWLLGTLVLTGCGTPAAIDPLLPTPTAVTVTTIKLDQVGEVLASEGRPLYVFSPDHHTEVTCLGACWGTWPPLLTSGIPTAAAGVKAADLATVTGQSLRVVTFKGWPLYRYSGDTSSPSTTASGQGLFLNGGPWYVIRPSGQIVTEGRSQ